MKKLHAYYLFKDSPLPKEIQGEAKVVVEKIKDTTNRKIALKTAYSVIVERYDGGRLKTIGRLQDLWAEDWQHLWNRSGFLHCTNQNYLLALILVNSGLFSAHDIRRKWTLIWLFSPHQYLLVNVGQNEWIEVDCWANRYGVPFGKHASKFNTSVFPAK
jgi:hypothetical protein